MIPEKNRGKVVLFNPSPWSGMSLYRRRMLPLGLLHLASPLERCGYSVTIIDQFADPDWKKILDESLKEDLICFGVTSMTGPQILRAIEVCRKVKEAKPDLPVVWGGVHATIRPDQVLDNPYADIAVIGEGEETFVELVTALENHSPLGSVRGIAYKEDGIHYSTGSRPFIDLNREPFPAYHLVKMDRYKDQILGKNHLHIICSRGCIYDCAYCWDPVFHKRKYRAIEPDRVLDQMQQVVRDYGVTGFVFGDDNFFIDLDWAYTIFEKIVRSELNIHIGKLFIRADTLCSLDKDFLDLIMKAGGRRFVIGAESGSPRILRLIKKRITIDEIVKANRKLKNYPVRPQFAFMIGLPTETPDEVGQSVRLANQLMKENPAATRSFNLYTPFPGTELFNMIVEMGFTEPETLEAWAISHYRNVYSETPWLSQETRKLVSILNYALMCHKQDGALGSVKKADPLSLAMAYIYRPLASWRARTLNTAFPIEPVLIRLLHQLMGRNR